jgi:hypothetical protein
VVANHAADPNELSLSAMGSATPIAFAYISLKAGDCMLRVPCPTTPGKWFLLYLKFPDSKSMMETRAACSPTSVILYLVKELEMAVAAVAASAHSSAKSAPAQLAVAGAILMSMSAVMPPAAVSTGAGSGVLTGGAGSGVTTGAEGAGSGARVGVGAGAGSTGLTGLHGAAATRASMPARRMEFWKRILMFGVWIWVVEPGVDV